MSSNHFSLKTPLAGQDGIVQASGIIGAFSVMNRIYFNTPFFY
jgi:hypothetical protein